MGEKANSELNELLNVIEKELGHKDDMQSRLFATVRQLGAIKETQREAKPATLATTDIPPQDTHLDRLNRAVCKLQNLDSDLETILINFQRMI